MIALDTNVLIRVFIEDTADEATRRQNEQARDVGCDRVVTFDEALLREDGFVAP